MSLRADRSVSCHFFDLDRTIIEGSSSFAFCRYLCNRHLLPRRALTRAILAHYQEKVLQRSLSEIHAVLFEKVLKGIAWNNLETSVDDFLDEFLWSSLYPPAYAVLKRQQHLGSKIALMSSSPAFLVQRVAKRLGIDFWMGTEYGIDELGCIATIKRFIDGSEKAKQLDRFSKEHGYALTQVKAYSDSYHDLPFLLAAGKAVAVNPDRRLRIFAQQQQWEIL